MSIQSWYGARSPRGSATPQRLSPQFSPSTAAPVAPRPVPTELHRDLAALTRVILGIVPVDEVGSASPGAPEPSVERTSAPEVAPIAPVPAATASSGRVLAVTPGASTLASVPSSPASAPAPVVTDDHDRLRRVLAERSFLDD